MVFHVDLSKVDFNSTVHTGIQNTEEHDIVKAKYYFVEHMKQE